MHESQNGSILPLLRTCHVAFLRTAEGLIGGRRQFQEVDWPRWSVIRCAPRMCRGWLPTLASSVELASTRGFTTNMRATRSKHNLLRVHLLAMIISLLASTCAGVVADRKMSSMRKGAHHRPLTNEQKADQNLQFMLHLYQSAAEPDGRPRQHRKFGSNTVRLLRPTASSVHYLPASRGETGISK